MPAKLNNAPILSLYVPQGEGNLFVTVLQSSLAVVLLLLNRVHTAFWLAIIALSQVLM